MSIKSPPWKAVSWAEKYPDDKTAEKTMSGLYYWTIVNDAGFTICSDWMTEEQARTIAAAPELLAFAQYVEDMDPGNPSPLFVEARKALNKAKGKP